MRYLLDTNVCVDYLTGRFPRVIERIRESSPEDLCVSSVAMAELRYGAEKSAHRSRNHARLDVFFQEVRILDFDAGAASEYGRVRRELESAGKPIGPNDMLIGAHARALTLVLVTDNVREFRRIRRLRVENWRG
ncbi:MAG: type II toxin-antitoxin system tRNA(fMet)-specific endonuclease VapC [Candidatus Binatia bacterium]